MATTQDDSEDQFDHDASQDDDEDSEDSSEDECDDDDDDDDDGTPVISDEEFARNKPRVLEALTSDERSKHAWDHDYYRRYLYPRYKLDPDIALAALTNCCGEIVMLPATPVFALWEHIPKKLQNDLGFCAKAISSGVMVQGKKDFLAEDFLNNLTKIPDDDCLEYLLEECPALASDRRFCLAVARSNNVEVHDFFDEFAPPEMRSDYEIMAAACSMGSMWHEEGGADRTLLNDPEFLKDVLELDPTMLECIEAAKLIQYPDLLINFLPKALRRVYDDDQDDDEEEEDPDYWILSMASKITNEVWDKNRHVVRAWFKGGGPFMEHHHKKYMNDRLVAFWICKHFRPEEDHSGLVESFQLAVPALLADRGFMHQAVALNPDVFHAATDDLQVDFSFQLIAFGETPGRYPYVNNTKWPRLRRCMIRFREKASEELQSHRDFKFLAKQNPSVLPSALIAEAKVLPDDERVKKLQVAMENIATAFTLQAAGDL